VGYVINRTSAFFDDELTWERPWQTELNLKVLDPPDSLQAICTKLEKQWLRERVKE